MLEIELAGEHVALLPQRALWWPAQKSLIIADVHWGKSGHFRRHGIALPQKTGQRDEMRLAALVSNFKAERLIIAGDLFHSTDNAEVENFSHWRTAHHSLHIDFVMGNHDILPAARYEGWKLEVHREKLLLHPFCISHDSIKDEEAFVIHGHIHPGIKLYGRGRQALSLACFAQDKDRMILPAFGSFTGCFYLEQTQFSRLYAVGEEEVIQVR
jgi:DNA ligase-associated metallophosphoesterase